MAPSKQISVLSPLLVGVAAAFCTIIVHALILAVIVGQVRRDLQRGRVGVRFWTDITVVTGHLVEIALWALAFEICGEFSDFAAAFYHSAVNYTTLGDDTVVMSARWRLLGTIRSFRRNAHVRCLNCYDLWCNPAPDSDALRYGRPLTTPCLRLPK
jgi:hypothetical protein